MSDDSNNAPGTWFYWGEVGHEIFQNRTANLGVQVARVSSEEIAHALIDAHNLVLLAGRAGKDMSTESTYPKDVSINLPKTNTSGWIPVSERMPESGIYVMVTDGKDITTACWEKIGNGTREHVYWDVACVEGRDWEFNMKVEHWMPLPAPPCQEET